MQITWCISNPVVAALSVSILTKLFASFYVCCVHMFLEFFIRALSEGLEVIWLKRNKVSSLHYYRFFLAIK